MHVAVSYIPYVFFLRFLTFAEAALFRHLGHFTLKIEIELKIFTHVSKTMAASMHT